MDAVLELWAAERSATASTPDTHETVAALLATAPDALLIAEEEGLMVGTLVAAWDGWRGNMYRLAVHSPLRRRGIATALVAEGHRRLREKGARRVTALVGMDQDEAQGLWRAMGYELSADVGRFVRNL